MYALPVHPSCIMQNLLRPQLGCGSLLIESTEV